MKSPRSHRANGRYALVDPDQSNDINCSSSNISIPQRKRRRRKKASPARRYELVLRLAHHDLVRCAKTSIYYIAWYERSARQMRRLSLLTDDDTTATAIIRRVEKAGVIGNPKAVLEGPGTIREALLEYEKETADNASAKAGSSTSRIHRHLIPLVGNVGLDEWGKNNYKQLIKKLKKRGLALGTISRIVSDLRAALRLAEENEIIDRAPRIPEPMSDDDRDSSPLKGRIMTIQEIAKLIDAVDDIHLLDFMVALLNTGGRSITILECDTTQIEWSSRPLFDMNPRGRQQNKKYRPAIIVPTTWQPWIMAAAPGRLITYNGRPVASVKSAFRAARERSGLKPDATGLPVNTYSIRHTLGRFLEDCDVPPVERSILLGHTKTYNKKTTERYSPMNRRGPTFLKHATEAVEKFIHDINAHTRKWNLLQPRAVKLEYLSKSQSTEHAASVTPS